MLINGNTIIIEGREKVLIKKASSSHNLIVFINQFGDLESYEEKK